MSGWVGLVLFGISAGGLSEDYVGGKGGEEGEGEGERVGGGGHFSRRGEEEDVLFV